MAKDQTVATTHSIPRRCHQPEAHWPGLRGLGLSIQAAALTVKCRFPGYIGEADHFTFSLATHPFPDTDPYSHS